MEAERNPGYSSPIKQALKGRNSRLTAPFALSGLGFLAHLPRALPWAISFCPFRAIIEWPLITTRIDHRHSYALNHSHREDAKSAKKHRTLFFLLCVLGVFAVKVLCFFCFFCFFRVFPCHSVANSYASPTVAYASGSE